MNLNTVFERVGEIFERVGKVFERVGKVEEQEAFTVHQMKKSRTLLLFLKVWTGEYHSEGSIY